MAKDDDEKAGFGTRLKQIGMAFSFTAKKDKLFLPLAIIAALIPLAAGAVLVFVTHTLPWPFMAMAVLLALLAVLIVLNVRTSKAVMDQAVDQPGAAYGIVEQMRGWNITPAVAVSTHQDLVHRAVGKPGVVLLAEGSSGRLKALVNQEKKKLNRVVGSTPVYDFVIGEDGGEQLSVRKLRNRLAKLPHNITAKQANDLNRRLTALKAASKPPMPKGPVPQNMKPPKGARRAMRGK
ncbi:MAG TPA: DUF4191 domain-containing protein [Stackebrandtia sp.]|jgi:lipoprotein signal peptidase|uniref:DUF4191 domain-containing protein n=1 Tax=Stackebrandtia sp. TaxID=2023065 RepID=UPI002D740F5B|nr:DUF4191 domain-containing protein [Stackebrandtia sp.]HZE40479.1 DUF4191 domain-containing protein [Stackebrandtia sp.]